MTHFGAYDLILLIAMTILGAFVGWFSKAAMRDKLREMSEQSLQGKLGLARDEHRETRLELEIRNERLAVRERELCEVQSLLTLSEQERDHLRSKERLLLERVRGLEAEARDLRTRARHDRGVLEAQLERYGEDLRRLERELRAEKESSPLTPSSAPKKVPQGSDGDAKEASGAREDEPSAGLDEGSAAVISFQR